MEGRMTCEHGQRHRQSPAHHTIVMWCAQLSEMSPASKLRNHT